MTEIPTPRTAGVQRYDLVMNYRAGSSIEEMEPSDDGEWVRWEDVQPSAIEQDLLTALKGLVRLFRQCGEAHRKRSDESKHDTAIADTWDIAAASLTDRIAHAEARTK